MGFISEPTRVIEVPAPSPWPVPSEPAAPPEPVQEPAVKEPVVVER